MLTMYIVCTVVGGVVLVVQLLLTLTGLLGDAEGLDTAEGDGGDGSSWFFQVLSFRSMVAALTFFGLGGGLAHSAGIPEVLTFFFAAGLGVIAMVGVAWIFNLLIKLREEGNVHIEYAVGALATVYLSIPGQRTGMGKVTVTIQNRSMEYNALTDGQGLASGKTVKILDIIDDATVVVAEQG